VTGGAGPVPEVVTPALLRSTPLPSPGGSKNEKGRLLVVGGSRSTPGAVLLAAEAALRVGAGKVQVATTRSTAVALAVAVPECLVVGLDEDSDGELAASSATRLLEMSQSSDAVLVGPGLGRPVAACALLEELLPELSTSLVVDALGTAFITAHPDGLRHLAGRTLATPNEGELAQLLGDEGDAAGDDVLAATWRAVECTGVTMLSGGESSFVCDPSGRSWRLDVGAPGAAVAGSGDVKAGAVAGFLARGVEPAAAGVWGAYVHGRVGERLTAQVGRTGFLARDVAAGLPAALAEVELGVTRPG
jgi:hydroxyethylthiazole kinase-like uncharacterized protein yjeF